MKKWLYLLFLLSATYGYGQVKIGDNANTINSNSLLEMESTNKGVLPPRVQLNDASSIAPLTGTVPFGMLVVSSGGTLADGYYFWNGSAWKLLAVSSLNTVSKSADATLLKTENFVLASGDITISLPAITASDNGLEITVKNDGAHTDLVVVKGSGGATIDENDSAKLTRYVAQSYIANGGNWKIKNKIRSSENLFDVNATSSWTTLQEVVEYLEAHMSGPTVVRLDKETYDVTSTITIDLDFPLTFQGLSYGTSTIAPATGIGSNPLFRCKSDCFFKMLTFDATQLSGYGNNAGEDAIRFVGNDTYNEVKDCTFDRFNTTILDSTNAEIWVFETDISNAKANGILVHGNVAGVTVKVAETDFISCNYGINLSKGTGATIQLASGGYYNGVAGDTAIYYQPTTFTSFSNISITGNSWNNTGKFIEGFDFTRSDGRDANATVESNAGLGDKNPNCTIGVLNNAATTSLGSANNWVKAVWTNTSSTTCKWTVGNNKITYQPNNHRNGWFVISGNLSASITNRTISIAIVKNGNTGTRFGETTLRITAAVQPFQFSTVVYVPDIGPTDYFELYCSSINASDVVTIQDINWFTNAQ